MNEQKLIDICFELVSTATCSKYKNYFEKMTQEQKMEWVADELRENGFDTAPCGLRWGVLKKDDQHEKT